jgi:hypothetical protein
LNVAHPVVVGAGVGVADGKGVCVTVGTSVGVAVIVGVAVMVRVGVAVSLPERVADGVGLHGSVVAVEVSLGSGVAV